MFPAGCSTPSAAALAAWLPDLYPACAGERVECFFAGQSWSDVFLVRVSPAAAGPTRRYFAKVYAADWRAEAEILFELDLLAHLDRKRVAVALPLSGRDGRRIYPLDLPEGRRFLVLFHAAPGQPLTEQPRETQSRLLGGILARCHQAAADFASPQPRAPLDLEHLLDLSPLVALAQGREEDLACLQRAADRVRRVLGNVPLDALPCGVCHGDPGAQNVFLEGGLEGRATLIDFEECGPGWYAYDLGHDFMTYFLFRKDQAAGLWQTFLTAYRSRRRLEDAEVAAAPAFALARFLRIHAHDNPIGALRGRWPAAWYVDGRPWNWLRESVQTLEDCLPR